MRIERFIPERQFLAPHTTGGTLGVENLQVEQISTSELQKQIKYWYENVREGRVVTAVDIADAMAGYPALISNENLEDFKGLETTAKYALGRLPDEVWLPGRKEIVFETSPDAFLQNDSRKRARGRSRWHTYEAVSGDDGKPISRVTIHLRSRADVVEVLTHIGVVEITHRRLKAIQNKKAAKEDLSAQEHHFYREMTEEWEKVRESLRDHLPDYYAADEFSDWIAPGTISVAPGKKLPKYDELSEQSLTAKTLAGMIHERLDKKKLEVPDGVIFANDFSLLAVLGVRVLQELYDHSLDTTYGDRLKQLAGEAYASYVLTQAKNFIKDVIFWSYSHGRTDGGNSSDMTPLEVAGQELAAHRYDEQLKENPTLIKFMDDMVIMQLLLDYRRNGNGHEAMSIVGELLQRLGGFERSLGISTLIEAKESPTSDPVRYVDFSKIREEVVYSVPSFISEGLNNLVENKVKLLLMPYQPGDLTYTVVDELKKLQAEDTSWQDKFRLLIELGKVGRKVTPDHTETPPVGSIVIPVMTGLLSEDGDDILRLDNQVEPRHGEGLAYRFQVNGDNPQYDGRPQSVVQAQAESVIMQTKVDFLNFIKNYKSSIDLSNIPMTVNMEHYHLARVARKHGLIVLSVDYVSDVVLEQELAEQPEEIHKIDTSLKGFRGRYAVYVATLVMLRGLAGAVST